MSIIRHPILLLLTGLILNTGISLPVLAEESGTTAPAQEQQVYGSQLMTAEERAAHRARMRAAKTEEEREQLRREHHQLMQERARELGVTLPQEPPARGRGARPR